MISPSTLRLAANVAFLLLFFVLLRMRYRWSGMRNAVVEMESA